ncbi:uncharacterized protein B0T15DRAFT_562591 [Chaetomium strumarium]|uniref:Uncharacterized protein n=1 Tax=Chaetomium strumarium TaxID=1170767 RepID=A0AAJ0GME4_9PEZI|nr:hypothetical protein B0T15DRAFT_562591 [Chaetomium strumarium]
MAKLRGLANDGMTLAYQYLSDVYDMTHPRKSSDVNSTCEVLERTVRPEALDYDPRDASMMAALVPRNTLFFLKKDDVIAVISAIDNSGELDQPRYTPCSRYRDRMQKILAAEHQQEYPPHDLDTIKDWKKLVYLATKRDWIVAKRQQWADRQGRLPGLEEQHFDIDPLDSVPYHFSYCPDQAGVTGPRIK